MSKKRGEKYIVTDEQLTEIHRIILPLVGLSDKVGAHRQRLMQTIRLNKLDGKKVREAVLDDFVQWIINSREIVGYAHILDAVEKYKTVWDIETRKAEISPYRCETCPDLLVCKPGEILYAATRRKGCAAHPHLKIAHAGREELTDVRCKNQAVVRVVFRDGHKKRRSTKYLCSECLARFQSNYAGVLLYSKITPLRTGDQYLFKMCNGEVAGDQK